MSNTKGPVRVIKREQRNRVEAPEAKPATPRETARDMVATVSNWVSEFQQKRRAETSQAIKTLLVDRPVPSRA
jgi:hypothetical protein